MVITLRKLPFKQQFQEVFQMHKHTRSRCSLDGRKRTHKTAESHKCLFCADPRLLNSNSYLLLTMRSINELQNHSYKNTMQAIVEEKKHNEDRIKFKYLKEFLEKEEILEECIPRKHYLARSVEVIQFYKYYQDLPRVFIKDGEQILNLYHTAKRFIFYRGLKKQLGLDVQMDRDKLREREKCQLMSTTKVLKGLTVDEEEASLSWSVLLMQKKLAKAIKNSNTDTTPRAVLQKIDRQYSFNKLIGSRLNEIVSIKGLEDVSNIHSPDMMGEKPFKMCDASTKVDFKTMFLKKNTHKQLAAKKGQQALKLHKKQRSMEDIPKILRSSLFDTSYKKKLIGSATSSQLKFASPSRKLTQPSMKRLSSGGIKQRRKTSNRKMFASGDVSCYTHHKMNTSQDKCPSKGKSHQRMASEQLDSQKKPMGNWTPEQKMRITINQKNVVHILLGSPHRTKIPKKAKH